jgi:hypothetical protein
MMGVRSQLEQLQSEVYQFSVENEVFERYYSKQTQVSTGCHI